MSATQNQTGNAFEYALASRLAVAVGVRMKTRAGKDAETDAAADRAREDFFAQDRESRRWLSRAAGAAVSHIVDLEEKTLARAGDAPVRMQPDSAGIAGDPRDIVLPVGRKHLAVSAKLNNDTVKNPRLQFAEPDFAAKWGLDARVSEDYAGAVAKVAARVNGAKKSGLEKWRDFPDLHREVYAPLLSAFRDELLRLLSEESGASGAWGCQKNLLAVVLLALPANGIRAKPNRPQPLQPAADEPAASYPPKPDRNNNSTFAAAACNNITPRTPSRPRTHTRPPPRFFNRAKKCSARLRRAIAQDPKRPIRRNRPAAQSEPA